MYKNPEKLKEYKQRHKEWRDISVTQLSNVNNILITLSTGLLALGINPNTKKYGFSCAEKISFILLVFSICYGIAVLFSRLYDFRISRHLALTRQRFYDKFAKTFSDKEMDKEDKYTCCDRLKSLKKFDRIKITKERQVDDIRKKFYELKERSDILGEATWIWTKYQVLFFLMGAGLYFITQLFKF